MADPSMQFDLPIRLGKKNWLIVFTLALIILLSYYIWPLLDGLVLGLVFAYVGRPVRDLFGKNRRILAGGEFDAETTDNALQLLKEAMDRFGWLTSIGQVLTDRGTQFYANKRDKNGNADSRFEEFLEKNKIKHIKARVKHPQTNGKLEKWNDTYERNRFRFDNFDNFMNWYNTVRFHESLDTKWFLQTPDIAFWSRLPEGCKLGMFLNLMETELNGL